MKRQSLVLLAVAIVAAGIAGCFKDPVSSLQGGPAVLTTNYSNVIMLTGDSLVVIGYLKDHAGNVLPATGVTWTSADPTIANVRPDTGVHSLAVPGNAFTRGFIRGVTTTGGLTTVTVASRGISAVIRVVVMPVKIPASQFSVTGAASSDTLVIPAQTGPPPVPADTVIYSAGDTLAINGTGFLNFDTAKVSAYATGPSGTSQGFVVVKTPQMVHIVFTQGASGKIIVAHVRLATTNAAVDTLVVDSLVVSDSQELARVRYRGAITQTGDTVNFALANGIHFGAATVPMFGNTAGILFDSVAGKAFATAGYTGLVTLNNAGLGTALLPSITSTASPTVTASTFTFPAANVTQVGDTLTVTTAGLVTVDNSTTIAFGAATPTVLNRSANSLSVINGAASYTGVVSVKNAKIGIARIATLKTGGSYTVNQASFLGTVTQLGDTMTVAAPANINFDTLKSTVKFGTSAAIVLSISPTTIKVLSPANFTGHIVVSNALLGTVAIPAMVSPASYTINGASFPNASVSVGGGLLGDTITITAPSGIKFDTAAAKLSNVVAGNVVISTSDTAWILSRTPTTIKAFARRGGVGAVTVTNLLLGSGTLLPYLSTPATFAIDSTNYTFSNAQTEGTAFPLTIPASNTVTVYGGVSGSVSADFWTFTTTASHLLSGTLAWFGSGNPYAANGSPDPIALQSTADLDLVICNQGMACDESVPDLLGYAAATAKQPETGTSKTAQPAAQYWAAVLPFTLGNYSIVYKLNVTLK